MILRGSSFSTFGGRLCRKRRPWLISLIIDLVVSYISKVEIPVSSYLLVILRGYSFSTNPWRWLEVKK